MSPDAVEKRREYHRNYMREWRSKNKEKQRQYESRTWENAATNNKDFLTECRCRKCQRLLFKGHYIGRIEVKCKKCSTYNVNENNVEVLEAL